MEKNEENTKKRKLDEAAEGGGNRDEAASEPPVQKQQRADATGDAAPENCVTKALDDQLTSVETGKENADNYSSSGSEVQEEAPEKRHDEEPKLININSTANDESVKENSSSSENKADGNSNKEGKMDIDKEDNCKSAKSRREATTKPNKDETENPYDKLRWIVVKNDGRPESLIKLVALKSLFSKQLPKMPRAYIARLVFDRRHTAIAILNDDPAAKDTDEEVIGSICYRAFPEMRFAEIAFCAVNAAHQVKVSFFTFECLVVVRVSRTDTHFCCSLTLALNRDMVLN